MDLASVVAALASVGARVSGSAPNSSVRVDSSRACPPGLAGPEPSGTIHDLGQHFHSYSFFHCVIRSCTGCGGVSLAMCEVNSVYTSSFPWVFGAFHFAFARLPWCLLAWLFVGIVNSWFMNVVSATCLVVCGHS